MSVYERLEAEGFKAGPAPVSNADNRLDLPWILRNRLGEIVLRGQTRDDLELKMFRFEERSQQANQTQEAVLRRRAAVPKPMVTCPHCHTEREVGDESDCCERKQIERLRGLLREAVDCITGKIQSTRLVLDIVRRSEEAL